MSHHDHPNADRQRPLPAAGSQWRHWKGDTVTVQGIVKHSETKELFVRYEHLGEEWIRPLSMWQDEARPGKVRFVPLPP